jgi:nitrate reductase gamma subunit
VAELAATHLASVVAGYLVTGLSLAGYVAYLLMRARRARLRAASIAAKRAQ